MPLMLRLHICLLSAPNVPVAEQAAGAPMAAEGSVKPSAQSALLAPSDLCETPEGRAQKPRLAPSARGAGGPCTMWTEIRWLHPCPLCHMVCRQPCCPNCSYNSFSDTRTIKEEFFYDTP